MELEVNSYSAGIGDQRVADDRSIAALDLGTNNCRLLVARPVGQKFEVIDSFSRIVRLGEGLAQTNRLSEAAMLRTLRALRICKRILERNQVAHVRCVATEACRRARNGAAFVERVRRATGIRLEILDQDEEARLAMLGCMPLIDQPARDLMMLDIGGGSTEILVIDRSRPDSGDALGFAISLPVGVVTLAESPYDGHDQNDYRMMVSLVRDMLIGRGAPQRRFSHGALPHVQMLGTSGTVTTLAALHLGLRRYDRSRVDGLSLSFEAISNVSHYVRHLGTADLASHPCIGRGRADLVVAGCAILDAVHEIWPVPGLKVADRGVREGILNTLLGHSLRNVLAPAHYA